MHLPRRTAPAALSGVTVLALLACSGTGASPAASLPSSLPSVAIPSIGLPSDLPSIALPSDLPSISIPPLPSDLPSISIPPLPSELPSGLPSIVIPSELPSGLPSIAIPTFHQAPDLEAQLPNSIRGVTMEKSSFTGDFFLGQGGDQTFGALVQQLGKSPSDLQIAGVRDPSDTLEFELLAFRLAGIPGDQFISALLAAGQAAGSPAPTITSTNLGGKQVQVFTSQDGEVSYGYVRGDVVYFFESAAEDGDALVAEIATALP